MFLDLIVRWVCLTGRGLDVLIAAIKMEMVITHFMFLTLTPLNYYCSICTSQLQPNEYPLERRSSYQIMK